MGLPSFTIVTPCLNGAATLSSTLESVRDQGYGGEVEHVVVDGGSTDGTLDILASAPDVRYISEPDRGLSDAVNKGIRMARNDVVGWLNADDVYLPGALGRVGKALAERPDALWATGPCLIIDADGREIRRFVTGYKSFLLRRYSYRMHLVQNFVPAPSTFVRKEAFDRVGEFDERFKYSMDYDLWLRLGRIGPPLVLDRAAGGVPHGGGVAEHDRLRAPVRRAHPERARARRRPPDRGRGQRPRQPRDRGHVQGHAAPAGRRAGLTVTIYEAPRLRRSERRRSSR